MRRLIALIPTTGKTKEQIVQECLKQWEAKKHEVLKAAPQTSDSLEDLSTHPYFSHLKEGHRLGWAIQFVPNKKHLR